MEKEFELSHLEDSRSHAAPSIMKDAVGDAIEAEGSMGFLQAVRLYPMAIFWSVGMSTAVIMEGYAVMLLSSFYALPQFNRKYGQQQPDRTFVVPASWKYGLSNGALCGEILGLFLTGIFQDRYGYRKTICAALLMVTGFIFILFFANGVEMLLVGEILCGIPW